MGATTGAFSGESLFVELVIGSIGFGLFLYGRKTERWPHIGAGLLLMAYPYFVSSALQMFGVGAAILIGFCVTLWLGW